jgi:hypothetical protein
MEKTKTLFDHFNHLQTKQDPNYFNTLSEADRKTWSNWMINKLLSMIPGCIEFVNEVQRHQSLEPELYYKMLIGVIPKKKIYAKYIKKQKKSKYSDEAIEFLRNYFMVSTREINDSIDLLSEEAITAIYMEHGFTEKEIKKLLK